jgi:hypothetical protein
MLQQLKETGVESMSARSEYVAIGPDGKKLTSSYVNIAKIYHEFNIFKTGAVELEGGSV